MDVYHGSSAAGLTVLLPSPRGTFGSGIYFTTEPAQAAEYGENLYSATALLRNPWVIAVDHASDLAEQYDFDSPSIGAMLTLPGGEQLIRHARATDGLYGTELQQLLEKLGHDGVVATYPDGCQEVVAFHWQQVEIISETYVHEHSIQEP